MNLKTMFLKEKSFEGYDDRAVLECLLSTAGIRTDVPSLVDRLFTSFGSLKNILEARPEQLKSVKGVSEKTATLVSMITPLAVSGRSAICGSRTRLQIAVKQRLSVNRC